MLVSQRGLAEHLQMVLEDQPASVVVACNVQCWVQHVQMGAPQSDKAWFDVMLISSRSSASLCRDDPM